MLKYSKMEFKVIKQSKKNQTRSGLIKTAHGEIKTPVFMPCATSGAVKGVSFEELSDIGFQIILANTYHLYLKPGEEQIKNLGNLQKWMNWRKPILTDSGGYQAFSLGADFLNYSKKAKNSESLVKFSSRGVFFRSHLDGSQHLFTPEKVIDIQRALGSDILMPLDYCPSANASYEEIKSAVQTTNNWFKRSWTHFEKRTKKLKNPPALFAIIQGGAYQDLREQSFKYLSQFPVDGFAIGGVANGGESKLKQKKAIEHTIKFLPKDKPRYLMGVGEPEDIIFAVQKGIDMFDCVLPTRLGRHGNCWITSNWKKFSKIDLRRAKNLRNKNKIMKDCQCFACKNNYSASYVSHLIKSQEMLGLRLTSLHNLWILKQLTEKLSAEI